MVKPTAKAKDAHNAKNVKNTYIGQKDKDVEAFYARPKITNINNIFPTNQKVEDSNDKIKTGISASVKNIKNLSAIANPYTDQENNNI